DLVVVPGRPRDHLDRLPASPVLVVEVADSSLRKDRDGKAALYARGGITDYWIVNRVGPVLEVLREPARVGGRWKYRSAKRLRRGATVSPLASPRLKIRVADLLP
ncbi:MAG: Uma2 family endonuclease, partial [Candidatus Rokuibacteriota bacterium]